MNREEAIEILIAVAVCDRPILSCDFCARYVGMGTDCAYPSDKEIEEAVLLLKGASKDMAISALREQEHFRDLTKKVEPLTLDELRRMEGQPVYIVENTEYWAIVNSFDQAGVYLLSYGNPDDYGYFGFYGKTWLAYRQKPEEGTV